MRSFFLTFVTHDGCHLCEHAAPVIQRVSAELGIGVNAIEMSSDDELVRLYSLRIPVVLGPDGAVLAEGAIEERTLRKAVREARRRQ